MSRPLTLCQLLHKTEPFKSALHLIMMHLVDPRFGVMPDCKQNMCVFTGCAVAACRFQLFSPAAPVLGVSVFVSLTTG